VSELPKGWIETKISDVTEYVQRGKGPKYTDVKSFPVINQKAIRWFGIQEEHLKYVREDMWDKYTEERFIRSGDILWNSTGTGTIGRACLLDEKEAAKAKVVDSHVTIVRSNKSIDPRYLFNWIKSPRIQFDIDSLSTGTTNQVELSKAKVLDTSIPLAPLNEQSRIADKLDSTLAKVDAAQARLDKIPNILKRFRQSVLAAATSGELTKEWREDNKYPPELSTSINWNVLDKGVSPHEIPPNWTWQHVGNIIDVFNSKRKPLKQADRDKRSGEYPYYGAFGIIDDIDDFLFDGRYLLLAEDGKNLESRQRPISLIAGGKFWVNNHAHVIQGKEGIKLDYLKYFFNSPTIEIDQFLTGMDQVKLNKNSMIKIPVPVPPEKEQKEIVRRVESLFTMAENFEKQYKDAKTRTKRLTQSILAKAFRGELVPQDDDDEPASELLARIKANLDHVTTKPKVKRKTKAEKSKD
jgi:type I restriction enzyme S subunit